MIAPHEIRATHAGVQLADEIRARIPTLTTERLTLTPPVIEDFPTLDAIVNGPGGDGIGGPQDRDETWFDFTQMSATWLWRGHGFWTVRKSGTDAPLGFAGIGFEPGDREPELGYLFRDAAWGMGYATEAGRAVLDFAMRRLGLMTLVSYIHIGNARSAAVATRLGATRDHDTEATFTDDDGIWVYRYDLSGDRP